MSCASIRSVFVYRSLPLRWISAGLTTQEFQPNADEGQGTCTVGGQSDDDLLQSETHIDDIGHGGAEKEAPGAFFSFFPVIRAKRKRFKALF